MSEAMSSDEHPTESAPHGDGKLALVTGATGYIGGRLAPALQDAGYRVRALARTPRKLRDLPWAERAEVVQGDVTDAESVREAMRGVDVAYYLVHALGTGSDFERTDREAARIFAREAREAGVRRIVYLGGLTPEGVPESLSRTCARAPRSAASSSTPGCPPPCCAPPWCWAPAPPPSRCSATSPSGCR